ncbi:MAG: four helix bundle protein [Candidatus Desantisbacteria bacterium]
MERKKGIRHFRDLKVYQKAFQMAMKIFEITKGFPVEERYSLVEQIREYINTNIPYQE